MDRQQLVRVLDGAETGIPSHLSQADRQWLLERELPLPAMESFVVFTNNGAIIDFSDKQHTDVQRGVRVENLPGQVRNFAQKYIYAVLNLEQLKLINSDFR
ncbi:hypothetical protein [Halobacillus sp. A5]|uniref:hypothetical protein n=1 Tax=Halobacillus sp. A5 TaxID=2880263 RepID=UPI0020A688CA|nr:hypothetical protein [Halobacillus sp. A5]MCP3029169.1 hypothetical protein [Halobacillus sp. A5]